MSISLKHCWPGFRHSWIPLSEWLSIAVFIGRQGHNTRFGITILPTSIQPTTIRLPRWFENRVTLIFAIVMLALHLTLRKLWPLIKNETCQHANWNSKGTYRAQANSSTSIIDKAIPGAKVEVNQALCLQSFRQTSWNAYMPSLSSIIVISYPFPCYIEIILLQAYWNESQGISP